ncbi:hypothetical protein KSP40_PGU004957 [Platanthera guangdongensis]|uniref:Uncharacterized protein n=1 Tax=Platanthera guangdongensis TaxID=2320717 RepID=A0ABR2MHA6_9ASPA
MTVDIEEEAIKSPRDYLPYDRDVEKRRQPSNLPPSAWFVKLIRLKEIFCIFLAVKGCSARYSHSLVIRHDTTETPNESHSLLMIAPKGSKKRSSSLLQDFPLHPPCTRSQSRVRNKDLLGQFFQDRTCLDDSIFFD